jgi:hypothetical protein
MTAKRNDPLAFTEASCGKSDHHGTERSANGQFQLRARELHGPNAGFGITLI